MNLDPNFREFIEWLHAHEVKFLLVGGYAVAAHGHPRLTADLDLWLLVDERNADAVLAAIEDFGFTDTDLTAADFLEPDRVVQLGYPPLRIDLMTSIDGVDFDEAYERRERLDLGDLQIPLIARQDLLRNKRATGRPQDLADVAALES